MRRFTQLNVQRLIAGAVLLTAAASPAAAQSNFNAYSSPVAKEYAATIGAPLTDGGLDFYEYYQSNARNVLGTWGTSDGTAVNRPTNIGGSTTMFGTASNVLIDVYGAGSDVFGGIYNAFAMKTIDVAHLYSQQYSGFTLSTFNLTFFGVTTAFADIQQTFTITAPLADLMGNRNPFLTTLEFDNRWTSMYNVYWYQSQFIDTQHQFTNVNGSGLAVVPEPSTYALMGMGLLAIGFVRKRRQTVA
ncbi:MAG: PEP-CTERM sorting domain-containing protein [Gemmatimonas sp.]